MSKSLGTGIDPLLLIDKYGADAVRVSLIAGTAAGTDIKISEHKIRGYRNFSNKIWNTARFVLMSTDNVNMEAELTAEDRMIMDELGALSVEVTKDIEEYRFYLAAEKLYHYVWHTFADKILEEAKVKLAGKDAKVKASAQRMLMEVLATCLKLLHPFMPFVTEELYGKLPLSGKKMLMIESWPT